MRMALQPTAFVFFLREGVRGAGLEPATHWSNIINKVEVEF
jgi:hypothetical protein